MRSGGYTLQQSLTLESSAIVKQALSLARRRGHSQITPLHVASAMLSSSTGLLKRACLQSHSHPLQCKALELCFNVALNRLPTSASSPLLGPHSHLPSLSNALVAAFKRAQAHQRRGSIESQHQQQPMLVLKVEIEQLVISILDDPSVSRVMREAGFSSTQVKTNVEKAVSLEISNSHQNGHSKEFNIKLPLVLGNLESQTIQTSSSHQFTLPHSKTVNQDVMSVLEAMMNKKTRNTVIVGECEATAESLVKRVIEKFDKKDVPSEMKFVQFISVPLFTLRNISKEEFELKLVELRSLVKSYVDRGVVLYLGNLDWVSEFWSKYEEQKNSYYSPVEYMIMELSRIINGEGENKRLWLMGTANFQTYSKCKIGRPSLETLWSLYPLKVPIIGNLALSLSLDHSSNMHDQLKKEPMDDFNSLFRKAGNDKQLNCCPDCSMNFKREAQAMMSGNSSSNLPLWLKQHKDENMKQVNNDQEFKDLCKKWNSICTSSHRKPHFLERVFDISSSTPSFSSTSASSSNGKKKSKLQKTLLNWPVIFDAEVSKPNLSAPKPDLLSNPNSSPNSASSSEASEDMIMGFSHKFKEPINSDNINILCHALEKKVPWQKDIIPEIVTTILKCRSGVMRSKREESWLLFLGVDNDGKENIARELAKAVFGSYDSFISIGLSHFSSKTDSTEEIISNVHKRARDENGDNPYGMFLEAMHDNPSRVFFVEGVDEFDYRSIKGFEMVIEDGCFTHSDGEIVLVKDAIVIFSCESEKNNIEKEDNEKTSDDQMMERGALDLNMNIVTEDDDKNSVLFDSVDKKIVFNIQVL